jgi:hypothetical protein
MAAFLALAYASISIPAIGAAVASAHIGLDSAAAWFGAASPWSRLPLRCSAGSSCSRGPLLVRELSTPVNGWFRGH